ncbi:hypothetical protein [Pseudomonas asplenii]|uniref:Uncharacterized protein n=1 Tax=Pseudomonas asplenii TaxID=53407 RepID=A0A1H6NLL4_9PSED|nr:hypothetical protein [Pseudomonas fuscovaginae]SEI16539.1 hypothetical protein SAMN05216581_3189 [Pseudomonas fuscovaginae]
MTPERFAQLAEIYGADLRRWPAPERAGAELRLKHGDGAALAALDHARALDSLLDGYQLPAPDLALVRQIRLAAGPVRTPSFWQRYAGWLSPAGFVGVGVAGIAAGILVASLSLPLHSAEVLPSVFDHGDADIVFTVNAEDAEQ